MSTTTEALAEYLPVCISANGLTVSSTIHPARELLVATIDGIIRFERSGVADKWRQTGHMLAGSHISSLLYEQRSGLLFAGSHFTGGIRVSEDGGKTWEERSAGLNSGHAYSLMVQYIGDRTLVYAGTEPTALYRSDDLGKNWTELTGVLQVPDTEKWRFGPPPSLAHLKSIAIHPDRPDTLYVCVEQGDLLQSTDAGVTWAPITSYEESWHRFRRDMHRVVPVPSDPTKMYLTTGVGLFYTEDDGASWAHLLTPEYPVGYPDPLFIDAADEQIIYVAGASAAPNPSWTALRSAKPGIVKSTDGGKTWRDIRVGLPEIILGNIEAMAMQHSREGGTALFMGTAVGEVYASDDAGESWQLVASDIPPVSKGGHFRFFLSPEARAAFESKMRALPVAASSVK